MSTKRSVTASAPSPSNASNITKVSPTPTEPPPAYHSAAQPAPSSNALTPYNAAPKPYEQPQQWTAPGSYPQPHPGFQGTHPGFPGSPPPGGSYGLYAQPPPQGYYQGYGYPPNGYYSQGQGMYYQQQPYGYQDRSGGAAAAEGIFAGLLGALACCCCVDMLF